jgi:hypothetical protein
MNIIVETVTQPGIKILPPVNPVGAIGYTPVVTNPFHFEVYTYTTPVEAQQMTEIIYSELFSVESINKMGSWALTTVYLVYDALGGIGIIIAVFLIVMFFWFVLKVVRSLIIDIKGPGDTRPEPEQPEPEPLDPADRFQQDIDAYSRLF